MSEFLNVKTDWVVFIFLVIAWSVFVGLKVLFENESGETSFLKNLALVYVKTSYITVLLWFLYAFNAAQFGHNPWPLNLVF